MFQRCVVVVAVLMLSSTAAEAQTGKKGGGRSAAATYRTLTGKVADIKVDEPLVTIEAGADGAKRSQTWVLSAGRKTLLLRAGKNNQYAAIALGELKKEDTVQAVVSLQANPSDQSHAAWWLVVYPPGTSAPAR